MFAIGLAVSYVMLPVQAAAYARISSVDTGHATAIFTAVQRSAGAMGVALLSAVLPPAAATGSARPSRRSTPSTSPARAWRSSDCSLR